MQNWLLSHQPPRAAQRDSFIGLIAAALLLL